MFSPVSRNCRAAPFRIIPPQQTRARARGLTQCSQCTAVTVERIPQPRPQEERTNGRRCNQGNQEFPTIIGPDASFKGELTFEKGLRLMGKFEGKINTGGRLHIAKEARMQADVESGGDHRRGRSEG